MTNRKMRETTNLERILMLAGIVMAVVLVLVCVGCGTARQHCYVGQIVVDLGSSYYAIEVDSRFSEGNPNIETIGQLALAKVIVMAAIECGAYLFPDCADTLYWIGGFGGYGAGAWNVGQLLTH